MSSPVTQAVAFCGYVCSVCPGTADGCPGCKAGGGDEGCPVRACSIERGLAGCWDCAGFPCDKGPFGSDEWRGLATALTAGVKQHGEARLVGLVRERLGDPLEYGRFRGMTAEAITDILTR
ncbi:MAG: DUF3795 domain-containing protein [Anaerolineae bacterium]|nr:DUF3795 domain-containing protein [Anaerolineae bacterium]